MKEAIVLFDDGSAIVEGDGSEDELKSMLKLFGTIDPETLDIIRILRKEGLAVVAEARKTGRTMSEKQFEMVHDTVASLEKWEDQA